MKSGTAVASVLLALFLSAGDAPQADEFPQAVATDQLVASSRGPNAARPTNQGAAKTISFDSLLLEMTDRDTMARWPDPTFVTRQASSYDRRSTTPNSSTWFANTDWSNFVRSEKVKAADGERTEYVLIDENGPGAIVRIWVGGYTDRGTVRFYIDGASKPVLSGTTDELIGGPKAFPEPFAATRARGRNLYAPIPYARHIKVTYDGPLPEKADHPGKEGFFYNINYRTYPAGTAVQSLSREVIKAARERVRSTGQALVEQRDAATDWRGKAVIEPGKSHAFDVADSPGPAALTYLQLNATDAAGKPSVEDLVLVMEFDGRKTVQCPVGTCFGFGEKLGWSQDWWREVDSDGNLTLSWIMPYKERCRITIVSRSGRQLNVQVAAAVRPWQWDDRSLYFHAGFRRDPAIDTLARSDFNYITVRGRGVYMGDTLLVYNSLAYWWGEGDEKIYIDDEAFPSHFGTGTEDYYGCAWGNTAMFNSPFHGQPRSSETDDGYTTSNLQGFTTNSRVRMLDRIPFVKSIKLDMEVWNMSNWYLLDYSVATFWYGDADDSSNAVVDDKLLALLARASEARLPRK